MGALKVAWMNEWVGAVKDGCNDAFMGPGWMKTAKGTKGQQL